MQLMMPVKQKSQIEIVIKMADVCVYTKYSFLIDAILIIYLLFRL
jgi:hypothetical protein